LKFWPPDPFHIKEPSPVLSLHRGRFFAADGSLPLLFPLFVQRDLRRSHSACQQQPHPKGHPAAVTGLWSIITQYMTDPMYWRLFQSNTKPAARPLRASSALGH